MLYRKITLFIALLACAAWYLIPAHQIFVNAQVITMHDAQPLASALVVRRGRIEYVGSVAKALSFKRWYSRVIDVRGRTLLPGIVDAHSHFLTTGLAAVTVDLSPPPDGQTSSLDLLYARVREAIATTEPGAWIIGFNYDNTAYPEARHPDKRVLDSLSAEHKIYLRHSSGHMGVANSAGLQELNTAANALIDETLAPFIGRYPDSLELNGLLQEHAAPSLDRFVRELSVFQQISVVRRAVHNYLSQGVTTAQDGVSSLSQLRLYRWLSRLGIVPLRLNLWAMHSGLQKELRSEQLTAAAQHDKKMNLSAVKIIVDGSPQGYTAFLSKPYFFNAASNPHYHGHALYSNAQLREWVTSYRALGWSLAIHANGDAAIDQVLTVLAEIKRQSPDLIGLHTHATKLPEPRPDVILVHAQTIRQDQIEKLGALGVSPSYFATHTYYWGDWHMRKSLGPLRAARISPLKSTEVAGIRYSIHSDAPVTKINPMQLLWSAVNRQTANGIELGPQERVSKMAALNAMTLAAAWQSGVDTSVGSIEVGKHADIIELSANPLQANDVRDIRVLKTYIGGKKVYQSP